MRLSARTAATLLVLGVLAVGLCARDARGQDTIVVNRNVGGAQTTHIAQWAVDLFNAPATLRSFTALTLDSTSRVEGDLAVLDGPLTVYGSVTGNVVAINADVTLGAGAVVGGDVVVLGGRLEREPGSSVAGSSRSETDRVDVRREGDRLELLGRRAARRGEGFDYRNRGRAFLVIGLGGTYNRIEGLPLRGGAGVEWWTGDVSGRIRGYGVFRTAGDFSGSREDIGYNVDGRLRFGRSAPSLTIGGRGYDLVVPTQEWPLSLHEVGWGTFLWHRDYRDYFLQRGAEGYLTFAPASTVSLTGRIARVEESSIAERDPWTPFRNDELWRPNPAIDAGDFTLLTGIAEYDSRQSERSSRSGTLLRATWEHGVGDDIIEQPLPPEVRPPLPTSDYTFDRASVDLRRYQRIGWGGQLRLRGFWTGPAGGDPLPIQRRVSLGGPDPMNGYAFRAISCNPNAADAAVTGLCDHVLLFQAEYRGGFGVDWLGGASELDRSRDPGKHGRWHDEGDWDWDWGDWLWFEGPSIVLFTNAGAGWLVSDDGPGTLSWDVGAGLTFGTAGLYVAKAIQDGEPLRVTVRVERRF